MEGETLDDVPLVRAHAAVDHANCVCEFLDLMIDENVAVSKSQ